MQSDFTSLDFLQKPLQKVCSMDIMIRNSKVLLTSGINEILRSLSGFFLYSLLLWKSFLNLTEKNILKF